MCGVPFSVDSRALQVRNTGPQTREITARQLVQVQELGCHRRRRRCWWWFVFCRLWFRSLGVTEYVGLNDVLVVSPFYSRV